MTEYRFPNKPGVYTLLIELAKAATIYVGGLGVQNFPAGLYTYTGSALGKGSVNLRNRIKRHLTRGKRKRWHIDFLLDSDASRLRAVVFAVTSFNIECLISRELARLERAGVIVKGFGSSDCRSGCQSHLTFFAEARYEELMENIKSVYRKTSSPRAFQVDDDGFKRVS